MNSNQQTIDWVDTTVSELRNDILGEENTAEAEYVAKQKREEREVDDWCRKHARTNAATKEKEVVKNLLVLRRLLTIETLVDTLRRLDG